MPKKGKPHLLTLLNRKGTRVPSQIGLVGIAHVFPFLKHLPHDEKSSTTKSEIPMYGKFPPTPSSMNLK